MYPQIADTEVFMNFNNKIIHFFSCLIKCKNVEIQTFIKKKLYKSDKMYFYLYK